MNYYQYVAPKGDLLNSGDQALTSSGRGPIDPNPVLSLLLEPRSLVVTRSKFYTEHLHGIDATSKDTFRAGEGSSEDEEIPTSRIMNQELVHQEPLRKVVNEGGELERTKRISLTFRDVEKVFTPRFR
jgi:alkylated DNA repair protein alkB family protein 6